MSKKVKIHISLAPEIHENGRKKAKQMGDMAFSTYVSMLIAKDTENSNKRKGK